MRTRKELVQLGKDMALGKIFTSAHVRNPEDIRMVFMALVFLSQEGLEKLKQAKAHVFYEYIDKAGPRSINGYPCFFSFSFLTREQWDVVVETHDKAKKAFDELK
jgi:hypothetical protein